MARPKISFSFQNSAEGNYQKEKESFCDDWNVRNTGYAN